VSHETMYEDETTSLVQADDPKEATALVAKRMREVDGKLVFQFQIYDVPSKDGMTASFLVSRDIQRLFPKPADLGVFFMQNLGEYLDAAVRAHEKHKTPVADA